jgi:hypothetical protein
MDPVFISISLLLFLHGNVLLMTIEWSLFYKTVVTNKVTVEEREHSSLESVAWARRSTGR